MTSEARERPILFSAPMVRAILDGRKTQTRRVVNLTEFGPSTTRGYDWHFRDKHALWNDVSTERLLESRCPWARVGDRLWVRETHSYCDPMADGVERDDPTNVAYRADLSARVYGCGALSAPLDTFGWNWEHKSITWRSSIHMPRWASRITLEVTDVRVQRVRDISEEDAAAEGVDYIPEAPPSELTHRGAWRGLWDSINGKKPARAWADNPWVWAVSFKVAEEVPDAE